MQTKLTLRLNNQLIEQAKLFARHQNKSLSQLVEEYFVLLTKSPEQTSITVEGEIPPITKSLLGILADDEIDERDYKTYLEEKYL